MPPTPKTRIPYPPVFHDWEHPDRRVATSGDPGGVGVETYLGASAWKRVVLTEDDATLLAASLLMRAGRKKLARRVLRRMDRDAS